MSTTTEKIKVTDKHGFHYEVTLQHQPHHGFSSAVYGGSIIAQVELGRILSPTSDNDHEWEQYEERLSEWTDEIKVNIIPKCEEYFNNKK